MWGICTQSEPSLFIPLPYVVVGVGTNCSLPMCEGVEHNILS